MIKPATDFADAKVTPWLATMDEAGMKPMVTASPLFSPADVKAMKEKHGGLKTGSKVAWAFAGVDSKTNNGDTTIDMRLNGAAEFEKGPATVSLTLESKGQPGDWKVKDLSIN